MQMINSTNPAATTPLNQPSANTASPMNAGSDLIAKMFQNQGIGGDLMKMLMNPSSLQNPQGGATSDSDSVESTGLGSNAAAESSSATDPSAAGSIQDSGAKLEKLMAELQSFMNILKQSLGEAKQAQQPQGQNPAEGSPCEKGLGEGASGGAGAAEQPIMSTRPLPLGESGTPQSQPTTGSSSSSQSQSNSANGNTTTTNTQDGKTTATTTDQSNVVRGNGLESANGTPSTGMTIGSLNQASLNRAASSVNDGFRAENNTSMKTAAEPSYATSLDGSTPPTAGTLPANSFNLGVTGDKNNNVQAGTDFKIGDVNGNATLGPDGLKGDLGVKSGEFDFKATAQPEGVGGKVTYDNNNGTSANVGLTPGGGFSAGIGLSF